MSKHHGYQPHKYCEEEVPAIVSKRDGNTTSDQQSRNWGGAKNEGMPKHQDRREQRQDPARTSPANKTKANNKISAMRLKFEQGSAGINTKEQGNKKWVSSCGSPVAERRRQLQQQFFAKDEASQSEGSSSQVSGSVISVESNSSTARKGAKHITLNTDQVCQNNRKRSSPKRVAEILRKKKEAAAKAAERKRKTEENPPRKHLPLEPSGAIGVPDFDEDPTITMAISDSELSPLEYNGSLLSDENVLTARDEAEDPRTSQILENRDMGGSRVSEGPPRNQHPNDSPRSRDNSFQDALQSIEKSFENDLSVHHHRVVKGIKQNPWIERNWPQSGGPGRSLVMESGRDANGSPVSMLAGLETDPSSHLSFDTKSVHADDLGKSNDTRKTSPSMKNAKQLKRRVRRDLSSTQILPDRSLFSTVDQEEEKEKTDGLEEATTRRFEEEANKVHQERENKATDQTNGIIAARYHMAEKLDRGNHPRKGILKNKHQESVQVLSSGSWYSSAASVMSDASRHLSPMQMLNHNRFSVGECVSAHLAEHPANSPSEVSYPNDEAAEDLTCNVGLSFPLRRIHSAGSASEAARNETKSPDSMEAMVSPSVSQDHREYQDIAKAMTNMANTASNAFLDVLVDTADKVVVTPLISIFNCVDASEDILCQGNTSDIVKDFDPKKVRSVRKKRRSRSLPRFRKFNA